MNLPPFTKKHQPLQDEDDHPSSSSSSLKDYTNYSSATAIAAISTKSPTRLKLNSMRSKSRQATPHAKSNISANSSNSYSNNRDNDKMKLNRFRLRNHTNMTDTKNDEPTNNEIAPILTTTMTSSSTPPTSINNKSKPSSSSSSPNKNKKGLKRFMQKSKRNVVMNALNRNHNHYESLRNNPNMDEKNWNHDMSSERQRQSQVLLKNTISSSHNSCNHQNDTEKENLENNAYKNNNIINQDNDGTKNNDIKNNKDNNGLLKEIRHYSNQLFEDSTAKKNDIVSRSTILQKKRKNYLSKESNNSMSSLSLLPNENTPIENNTTALHSNSTSSKNNLLECQSGNENETKYDMNDICENNEDDNVDGDCHGFDTIMRRDENGSLSKRMKNAYYDGQPRNSKAPFETIEIDSSNNSGVNVDESFISEISLSSPSSNDNNTSSSFCFDYGEDDEETDFDEFRNFGSQPILLNNGDDDLSYDDNEDDDYSGSSTSCASTVVNDKPPRIVRPPPTASKEEQAKFYWELCYGKGSKPSTMNINPKSSWSANRKPPMKSCLSAKKTQWTEIAQSSSKRSARRQQMTLSANEKLEKRTPTVLDSFNFNSIEVRHNPSPLEKNQKVQHVGVAMEFESTPSMKTPQSHNNDSCMKSVKFGDSSAAEFESTRPTFELTPLPTEKVREQYPVEEKELLSDDESTEMHNETARNGERLAMWDDDFDDYIDEWEDNDADVEFEGKPRESLGGKSGLSNVSRRNERRSSVFFSRGGGSLVEIEPTKSQRDDSNQKQIPDSIKNDHNNPLDKIINDSNGNGSPMSGESMQFSSPSISSSYRLSTSESETSKVTPKAALHSSSSLLRSVHSEGGAHISGRNRDIGNDDTSQDLKPSQLDETLQKAERSACPQICHSTSQRYSFTDKIIQETIIEPTKEMMNNFGGLLKERSHIFEMSFENQLSSSWRSINHDFSTHSFVDISGEVCKMLGCEPPRVCKNDGIEVLKMIVAFLEQEVEMIKICSAAKLKSQYSLFQQTFDVDDADDFFSILMDAAFTNWEKLECQAFHTVSSCFQLVNQSNFDEEATMKTTIQNHTNCRRSNECLARRHLENIHQQVEIECQNIERLLESINEEEESIKKLHLISSFWSSRVAVERNSPLEVIDFILLKMFLSFYEKALTMDEVNISYSHLDGHSSETQVMWRSKMQTSNDRRQSCSSVDSADGIIELLATTPTIHRIQNETKRAIGTPEDHQLPNGSSAYQMYTSILNDETLNKFLSKCCRLEEESGILTITDVFQRLDLMAQDVMELHKYYSCRTERPQRSMSLLLNVTISFGVAISIGIRFTYDLGSERTILYVVPSEIFIYPIAGEPAVPIKILTQVANHTLSSGHLSNAFILKRICSVIVDTIQGRYLR